MRAFWILLCVAVLAAAIVLTVRGFDGSGAPSASEARATPTPGRAMPARPRRTEPGRDRPAADPGGGAAAAPAVAREETPETTGPDPDPVERGSTEPAAVAVDPAPAPPVTTEPPADPGGDGTTKPTAVAAGPGPETVTPPAGTGGDETTEPTAVAADPGPAPAAAKGDDPPPADEATALAADLLASAEAREQEPPTDTAAPAPVDPGPTAPAAAADPGGAAGSGSMVRQEDGTWLVDDRFVLRGSGTQADPYRVSWEHLVSASETYKPRKGMTDIPEWVQMLHGTQVKLTGYLAFPLGSQSVDEALVMLNQWDGCCIGVPPSPYDGVEVRMSKPIELKEGHFFRFGNVTGEFKVDPYLVNDWLVGLYLIEEARLEAGM